MLARLVREQGKSCVAAEGPGAAYAVADENGIVANYTDDAASADCRLDLVDLGVDRLLGLALRSDPRLLLHRPRLFDREGTRRRGDERLGDKLEEARDSA
ncbi:hypothetical protein HX613_16790, partial [Brevibacterium sp. UCMA 11754]|nr:hypothetical protein [Brevibacterium sp. UCMA 11754]